MQADPPPGRADKIARILGRLIRFEGCALLDIGTGDGSNALRLRALGANVTAIDTKDRLPAGTGLDFRRVEGTTLPFSDASFDAVVYTHVIEHVGGRDAQRHHLTEIRRVLRADGALYLAVPNRWAPVEPHYRLPLLSWFPDPLASAYVRLFRRAGCYDCRPLSRADLRRLFAAAGLDGEEVTPDVLDDYLRDRFRNTFVLRAVLAVARLRCLIMPLIPVLVFVARPNER